MTPNKYMKQEREKSLLYTPFQEINKVNSPPFQGIIGSKDSKKTTIMSRLFDKSRTSFHIPK